MESQKPDNPTNITVECLRGHTRDVTCSDNLENDDIRATLKELACPQCGARTKTITDGEIWIGCAEPHHADDHGTPSDQR